MTDTQYRNLQKKAARTADIYRRRLETNVNRLQAIFQRLSRSKTIISESRYEPMFAAWARVRQSYLEMEKAMADAAVRF